MELSEISAAVADHVSNLIDSDWIYDDIYNTAVDYYGEKNVSFQANRDPEVWYRFFREYGFRRICDLFRIDYDKFSFDIRDDNAEDTITSHAKLNEFLGCIHRGNLKECKVPLFSTLIHFENFEVTNEKDKSTFIEDMYAAVYTDGRKRICFYLEWCRTTFSFIHFNAGYCHSHIPSGTYHNHLSWKKPCLGSGPINVTITSLRKNYEEDMWRLFWHELNLCIHTESLAGGPYFRLSEIRNRIDAFDTYEGYDRITTKINNYATIMIAMIESGKLKFVYDFDHIVIGNSFADFYLIASNAYLDTLYKMSSNPVSRLNSEFENDRFFRGNIDAQGRILRYYGQNRLEFTEGHVMETNFRFKEEIVPLRILPRDDHELPRPEYLLLSAEFVSFLYSKLILLANYLYGNYN